MFSKPKCAMKCLTDSAIELTWPGVPVTACASIRPFRSKTPAERSPHSRTIGLNAVRNKTCACSSTTAISRCHMIWRSIRFAPFESLISCRLPFHDNAAGAVDMGVKARRHERGCFVFRDHGRTCDGRPRHHLVAAVQRNLHDVPRAAVEKSPTAGGLLGRLAHHF